MKFKIGDRVKIINSPFIKEWSYWVSDMNETIGKTGKIVSKSIVFSKCYKVEIDNVSWHYPECTLKKVSNLPDNLFTLD